jgi:hypothetical protein
MKYKPCTGLDGGAKKIILPISLDKLIVEAMPGSTGFRRGKPF